MAEEQPKKLTGWFLTTALAASLSLNAVQLGGEAHAGLPSVHTEPWKNKCVASDHPAAAAIRAKLLSVSKGDVGASLEVDPETIEIKPGTELTIKFGDDTPGQVTPTCFWADLKFPATTVLD